MFDAACIGESMVLLAPDPPRPLREGGPLRVEVAGAESNVAINLAILGARTAWVSRVGADPLGEIVRERVAGYGVDTTLVEVDPSAPTGVFFKDPGTAGTRVHYYRNGSAASTMDSAVFGGLAARLVHLSGVTPALSASCADLVEYGLRARPVSGATMSFDVNYRPALWPVARAAEVLAGLADRADIVFVGLDEAATLWGCAAPEDVRAVLPRPGTLVVKDGPVGATAFGAQDPVFVPAPPVDVVEPVGAGDAFAAGYLYGVLRGLAEPDRLRLGHRVAAATLRSVGDIGAPAAIRQSVHRKESVPGEEGDW